MFGKHSVLPFLFVLLFIGAPARAQSFDCTKARGLIETAICADATLKTLDALLGSTYARLLTALQAREPAKATQLRDEERRWVQERDRNCGAQPSEPSRLVSCLSGMYRARLAALSEATAASVASLLPQLDEPAAHLSVSSVSAGADGQALLTVDAPGRFVIRAESKTGVALQLVDMITGPGAIVGEAGARDGRLDVLLDRGVYKLRSFGAHGAAGSAALVVEPFRNLAPAGLGLLHGGRYSGELAELQQMSFWVVVDKSGFISVEAVGRALQDLKLWRDGTELSALEPKLASIETRPGRAMTQARLEGQVEPGVYLVTTYGGAALPWNDDDKAQPFHIRSGHGETILGGWVDGVIGPSGSVRFEAPPPDTYMRLELPDVAPVRLVGVRGKATPQIAVISKTNREPVAALSLPLTVAEPARIEIQGFEGQPFRLRLLRPSTALRVEGRGPHLVSVDVVGEGGDELPASAVLARFDQGRGSVVASNAPRIGPGLGWRAAFNLRGVSTILIEVAGSGPIEARALGPGVRLSLQPLLGTTAPRADGRIPSRWDVEAGWYVLKIEPVDGAAGVMDLTIGPPGLAVDPPSRAPVRTSLSLGVQNLDKAANYQIFTNTAPGLVTGPTVRALPADLAQAPLRLFQTVDAVSAPPTPRQAAPQAPSPQDQRTPRQRPPARPAPVAPATGAGALDLPVHVPMGGTLRAVDGTGATLGVTISSEVADGNGRTVVVRIPPAERERRVTLFWQGDATVPELPPVGRDAVEQLAAGTPHFFDLAQDQQKSLLLRVPEGGLYRIGTLGRLKTTTRLSTSFVPMLAEASDNGPGHNALLQTYLRAGIYRVTVSAKESTGRLGLVAAPASLDEGGVLVADGSVRASLSEGHGIVFPIDITNPGLYRLDLYGLDRTFDARIEDADGWPLTPPGKISRLEQHLEPGRYRLVVAPGDVEARVVARLTPVLDPPALDGHGPHPLPFDQAQAFQWRESDARDAPRLPDRWTFTLYGTANITLDVSDGMVADLLREGESGQPIARIVNKRGFSGQLAPGRYMVEARSLGRNDRLDYEITLRSTDIQPGQARFVNLPAKIPFAIGQDRVVSITTFGRTDLTGILRDAEGRVIERLTGRTDDWNIALSRRLAAGAYQLELVKTVGRPARNSDESSDSEAQSDDETPSGDADEHAIEVHLALPDAESAGELSVEATRTLSGPQIHDLSAPVGEAGQLLVFAAQSSAELTLTLERREEDRWRLLGLDRGRAPVLAMPSDGDGSRPLRVSVWAVDGGAQIAVAVRSVAQQAQQVGKVTLSPLRIDGVATPVAIARIAAPSLSALEMRDAPDGVRTGSSPGRALEVASGRSLFPQSDQLWLLARGGAPIDVALDPLEAKNELALALGENEIVHLRVPPARPGRLRFWRADSSFDQPGLDAGRGMGVAEGSAFGLEVSEGLRIWNATGQSPLHLHVAAVDAELRELRTFDGQAATVLRAAAAQPLALGSGTKLVELALDAGVAAVLDGGDSGPVTVWTGDHPLSRALTGNWTRLTLVNASSEPRPAAVTATPVASGDVLDAGRVLRRFFGAAGSRSVMADAVSGDRLVVVGAVATFISRDGQVLRGSSLVLAGPGEVVLDHPPGLVAAWLERAGKSPWPAVIPRMATLPQTMELQGETVAVAIERDTPILLRARTTSPVIVALAQGDEPTVPILYPSGAEFHRYLAAGRAELRLYSPYEGPLGGSLELTATPIDLIGEGLGEARVLAPGAAIVFGFEVTRAGMVGVGVRAAPDHAEVRLLTSSGQVLGDGVAQMRRLDPGRYLIEARAPAEGSPLIVRPALVGIAPPPAGPPPDVAAQYLEMVGLTPSAH